VGTGRPHVGKGAGSHRSDAYLRLLRRERANSAALIQGTGRRSTTQRSLTLGIGSGSSCIEMKAWTWRNGLLLSLAIMTSLWCYLYLLSAIASVLIFLLGYRVPFLLPVSGREPGLIFFVGQFSIGIAAVWLLAPRLLAYCDRVINARVRLHKIGLPLAPSSP